MLEHINVQHQLDFQQVTSYTSQHLLNLSLGGSATVAQQDASGSDLPWEGTPLGVILEHAHGRYSQHYSLGDRSNADTNYQSIVATCYSKTRTIFVRKNADKRIKTRQERLEDGEQKNNKLGKIFSFFCKAQLGGEIWRGRVNLQLTRPCQISSPSLQCVTPARRKTSKSSPCKYRPLRSTQYCQS